GDGRYEFNGPPVNPRPIQYASIENVVANGPYHLVLDMDTSGFGNAAADDILMRLDPTSTNLQLLVNAAPFFEGEIARILSLQLLGSADDETFTVDDVNGLPLMQTSHPSIIADDNPLVAGVPRVLFAGNGGVDQLRYQLTQGSTSQTYGLGDGAGDGFGADAGGADGEVATIGTGTQVLYFTDLERPVTTSGTPGGTLTIVADDENQLLEVIDADDPSLGAVPGPTHLPVLTNIQRVLSFNEDRDGSFPHRAVPYAAFDWAGGAFTALVVQANGGDDVVDVVSFDPLASGLTAVTIQGGGGRDTLSVLAAPTNTLTTLEGNDGDDLLQVGTLSNDRQSVAASRRGTLDLIQSTVTIDGGRHGNTLVIEDGNEPNTDGHAYILNNGFYSRDGDVRVSVLIDADSEMTRRTLKSGAASDTFFVNDLPSAPTLTILNDAGGDADTLNFTDFGIAVAIDLDSRAAQSMSGANGGDRLQLAVGTFENFVGGPGNDIVHVDPLVGVARTLSGGGGQNTLYYDGQGAATTDTGAALMSAGFAAVNYSGFANRRTTGAASREGDTATDANVAFNDSTGGGTHWIVSPTENNPPFSSQQFATNPATTPIPGVGGNFADWTFNDLAPGTYLASATWVRRGDRATNTLYQALNSTNVALASVRVNQSADPSRYNFGGSEWQHLFYVTVTENSVTIRVSDAGANGTIAADAVRLEPVSTLAAHVMDNGLPGEYATTDYTLSNPAGATRVTGTIHGLFGDADRIPSTSGGTATWNFTGLTPGRYLVSATWTPSSENSMNARYRLNGGGGLQTVSVDQEQGPRSFLEEDIAWQNLAVVTVTAAGSLAVELSNNDSGPGSNNRYIVADAIRIVPVAEATFETEIDGATIANGNTLDFGLTRQGERADREITITNTGGSHLLLSDL
ncbi:MAG: hypothetical protein KDA55_15125, partial [Planctomycetales bacterium]|nr:hypothetical protein [Planctomycetales bacterium]